MTSKKAIANEAMLALQKSGKYNGLWLSDETLSREINQTYSHIKEIGGISRRDINNATSPRGIGQLSQCGLFSQDNKTGIFRYEARHIYCVHEKKVRSRIFYYFIDKQGKFPSITQPTNVDFPGIASDSKFTLDVETRSQKRARIDLEGNGVTNEIEPSIQCREVAINDEITANVRNSSSQSTEGLEINNNEVDCFVSEDVKTFWWSINA